MPVTIKQFNMKLTKEDLRRLEELIAKFGESQTNIMRRALNKFYDDNNKDNKK